MDEVRKMPFGKAQKVGNFVVLKFKKTLSKSQVGELRKESGIPKDKLKNLERAGLPYIKVSAISGVWSVEFAAPSTMFMFLDSRDYEDEEGLSGLHGLFTQWLTDTLIIGDKEYIQAKSTAMNEFLARQKTNNDEEVEEEAIKDVAEIQGMINSVEDLTKKLGE